ncbi:MAG: glycosyl hydrolase [Oscillospiraceae bacterium]|nr:glycosyl hydrolase [Oscillospiraceae bacterium]
MRNKKFTDGVKGLFNSVSEDGKFSGKMAALFGVILVSVASIIACIITLAGQLSEKDHLIAEVTTTQENQTTTTAAVSETTQVTEPVVTTAISEFKLSTPMVNQMDYEKVIESEDAKVTGNLNVLNERPGFSGSGYVSGFTQNGNEMIQFSFDIPASQHYDVSVCFASDAVSNNQVYINGDKLFDFKCTEETLGQFVVKTYYGVYLNQGKAILSVHSCDGGFDVDYMKVQNNKSVYEDKSGISPDPVNPNASEQTRDLLRYLTQNYGVNIITGQYASDTTNTELEEIKNVTSNYPAIRFGDMNTYSVNQPGNDDEVAAAAKWAENGGIVGYIWHWKAPMHQPEVYAEKTDFSVEKARTDIDIVNLSIAEIEDLWHQGMISEECVAMVRDIDLVSAKLQELERLNIPVLWRPLQEGSGKWFWWGAGGADNYKWLWNFLYRRQTEYHKLNNLIWIWNGQGSDCYVDESTFDIASVDIYDENADNTSYYKQYQWLDSLTGKRKMIALSECGNLPDIELSFRDRAVWSFFGLWYGDYILDEHKELSEKYNSRDSLVKIYNSDRTITLDKYKNRVVEPPVEEQSDPSDAETQELPDES